MDNKKITIRKKMSNREYVNLLDYLDGGNGELDLSEYEDSDLAKIEVRAMRFTKEDKKKMDEFFDKFKTGVSVASVLASFRKKKVVAPKVETKIQYVQAPASAPAPASIIPPTVAPAAIEAPPVQQPMADGQVMVNGMVLCAEYDLHPRPKDWACPDLSFYIDPTLPLADRDKADNIDLNIVVHLLLEDVLTQDDFYYQFGEGYRAIALCKPDSFVFDVNDNGLPKGIKTDYCTFSDIFAIVTKYKNKLASIMDAPEPTEEEKFERYKSHAQLEYGYIAQHQVIIDNSAIIDAVDISGNKIVIDEELGKVCEYEDADVMELDMIWLSKNGIIEDDKIYDVFGKKMSVDKIIKKLQKKYPDGLDKGSKLYYSEREAYLDGVLKL